MTPTTYERFCILRDQRRAGEEAPQHTEKQAFAIAVLQLVTGAPAPDQQELAQADCRACRGTNKSCAMNCGSSASSDPKQSMADCDDCESGCNWCRQRVAAAQANAIQRDALRYRFLRSAGALQFDELWAALANSQEDAFDAAVDDVVVKLLGWKPTREEFLSMVIAASRPATA